MIPSPHLAFSVLAFVLMPTVLCAQPTAAARLPDRRAVVEMTAKAERLPTGKTRLSVRPPAQAAAGFKLLDAAGKEVSSAVTRDGMIEAVVESQRGYILTPTANPRRALPKDGLELPARYITLARDGQTLLGGLFLRPTRLPLVWDASFAAYATELLVGYEFVDGSERALAAPKTVNFFAEGSDARIEADTVVIERSGGSGYKRVRLTTRQREGETLFIARAGPADELKTSVAVHRDPGSLQLSLAPMEIPAFGIGTGMLSVNLLALDGLPLAPAAPLTIQFSSRRLRHVPSITLPVGSSSVDVEIRSVATGGDQITVRGGGLQATQPVASVFPVAAVVATVLGGVFGGSARYLRNRGKRTALLARRITEGALVGVIVVGAAWAGLLVIDFGAGVLGTPFGAFVLSALAGYVGCALLDRVAKKTFGRVSGNVA